MPQDQEHDRRLAARAGDGDERAFAALVARHREALLRYVVRRFRPDLAEDAVQEAFLSAHRALTTGARPAEVRAWLTTIAWRRAYDLSQREPEGVPLDVVVVAQPGGDPETRAIQANELDRVVAAMTELPERQLTALKLRALEGRSHEEIGSALDVGVDAAKSLIARSRRTLTSRLEAAELDCGQARVEMEAAAARGVRLSGKLTAHIEGCRACARAHRSIRRRRRVALWVPFGLIVRSANVRDRLRELIAFNPAWEAQVGAAKLCTAACLSLGAGAAAAPTVTVAVPVAVQSTATPDAAEREPAKPKPSERKRPEPPQPTPTPVATVALAQATPVATVAHATPTATPTPNRRERPTTKETVEAMIDFWERNPDRDPRPPVPTPTASATATG